ncbi:hypothetical protein J6590_079221 [Homalodisca vitripennis]|nr:hypothetical protein J6590_079221 [Homalodisca vitripennis]
MFPWHRKNVHPDSRASSVRGELESLSASDTLVYDVEGDVPSSSCAVTSKGKLFRLFSEVKISMDEAKNLKKLLGKYAFNGKNVRMSSCHVEGRAILVGCLNIETKVWLEKEVQGLSPFEGIQLKIGLAKSLVKIFKVSTFTPKEVDSNQDLFEAFTGMTLKRTNRLLEEKQLKTT